VKLRHEIEDICKLVELVINLKMAIKNELHRGKSYTYLLHGAESFFRS
jgi:hypothetical protein